MCFVIGKFYVYLLENFIMHAIFSKEAKQTDESNEHSVFYKGVSLLAQLYKWLIFLMYYSPLPIYNVVLLFKSYTIIARKYHAYSSGSPHL